MVTSRGLFSAILLAAASQVGVQSAFADENVVIKWNANAATVATKACMEAGAVDEPFHEGRMYAMMHIAIHDALNAIDRKYQPYTYDKKAEQGRPPRLPLPQRHAMFWQRPSAIASVHVHEGVHRRRDGCCRGGLQSGHRRDTRLTL